MPAHPDARIERARSEAYAEAMRAKVSQEFARDFAAAAARRAEAEIREGRS